MLVPQTRSLKTVFFLAFLFLSFGIMAQGGGFRAKAILGVNASQIDGDLLVGFDKLGISGGAGLSYTSNSVFDVSVEFLYSRRGARSSLFGSDSATVNLTLNYLELPVIFSIRDWFIEDGDYYRVRLDGGLSVGNLFNADLTDIGVDEARLRNIDLSFLIGAGYRFNKNVGIGLRYTRALRKVFLDSALPGGGLRSYFWTFRTEFFF